VQHLVVGTDGIHKPLGRCGCGTIVDVFWGYPRHLLRKRVEPQEILRIIEGNFSKSGGGAMASGGELTVRVIALQ
jgi:hypothetical protein